MLMNGRLSERSLRRYSLWKGLFSQALLHFDVLAVQSEEDGQRFTELGAKISRISVTGNCKFDVLEQARAERRRGEALGAELGLENGAPLILAGSSRPGEEEKFLEAFKGLRQKRPGLKLLLAPRHLERVSKIEKLCRYLGFEVSRRSAGRVKSDLILLDTLGELSALYSLGTLAWIGGSWGPYGGQNPLEASAQGLPVLFGPDMAHFREASRVLLEAKAAIQCGAQELEARSLELLKDSGAREAMGQAALAALKKHAGASQRSADLAWKLAVLAQTRDKDRDWRNQSAFASLKVSEFGKGISAER
jgi:3-deoxy-D-manno-octulosonic-acid transferase